MNLLEEIRKSNQFAFDWEEKKFTEDLIYKCSIIMAKRGVNHDFEPTEEQLEIIKQLYWYCIGSESFQGNLNRGLALIGPVGTGKTLIMKALVNTINRENKTDDPYNQHNKILFRTSRQISNDYGKGISVNQHYEQDSTEYYANSNIFIDDIGKEPLQVMIYGNPGKPISDMVAHKYDFGANKKLFFTSNLNEHKLTEHYGASIFDRLKEMCNILILKGESLRK